jgi:hypothetical protein
MKDYLKYKQWLKKGDYTILMCYECNFIDLKKKYLLIDSCTTIDVIIIMQGFLNLKPDRK